MKIKQLDHVALHVSDLPASIDFYRRILGLTPLPRPDFDFDGAWFRIGQTQELHLIAGRELPAHSQSRGTHFAMAVEDIESVDHQLSATACERTPIRLRPDFAKQIFICDPDGHWIELVELPG